MPSRLLRCIAVSVFLSASVCVCFVTLAAFVYVRVCVCVRQQMSSGWMHCCVSLSVLYLVSWFHQSAVIPSDIRAIKLILKEQKKQEMWFGFCLCTPCTCLWGCACQLWMYMRHTPVFLCATEYSVYMSVCVCMYNFYLFVLNVRMRAPWDAISTPRAKCILC